MGKDKIKQAKSTGYRKKGGTHGSLSKAGKTRDQNKARWDLHEGKSKRSGLKLKHIKKHKCPRVANRQKYNQLLNKKKQKVYIRP